MKNFRACVGNTIINRENYFSAVNDVLQRQSIFRYHDDDTISSLLESRLSEIFYSENCRVLCNATAALKSALLALSPNIGDVVLIPRHTFIATAGAILSCGLIPKLVDTDEYGGMSVVELRNILESGRLPFAIIAVHLDGSSCKISEIQSIAKEYGVYLIEDASQAFGVRHKDRLVGTFGEFGCFSFQENKILSSGEGGAFICNKSDYFANACMYSDNGCTREGSIPSWNENSFFGENYKITELCSSIILQQLEDFDEIKNKLWQNYEKVVGSLDKKNIRFERRDIGDMPVSVWFNDVEVIENLKRNGFTCIDWSVWDLSVHPVILGKKSPYGDGFPWNLRKSEDNVEHFKKYVRVSLPIPFDETNFERLFLKVELL
ncbi:hypothetical protein FACS1894122_06700 [Alphaproteobacteria bacterium]|nr:hypothetical protein FACS1894122_06700 [Alphaproteobacteria bacterium]